MDEYLVLEVFRQAMVIALLMAMPILGMATLAGLLISIFQTTTSIQEQTLAFLPKLIAVFGVLIFMGNWMLRLLVDFTVEILTNINQFIG